MRAFPYTNIGHCIYCDSTEEPLTREHVIARGLGGDQKIDGEHEALVLQRATCEDCREKIRKLETEYLQTSLATGRHLLELSRKDRRPSKFPVRLGEGDETIEVAFQNFQCALVVPSFSGAFALGTPQPFKDTWFCLSPVEEPNPLLACGYSYDIDLDESVFARVLAKIAHGYLTSVLGPNGFRPLLRQLILEGAPGYRFLVGGTAPQIQQKDKSLGLHRMQMRQHGRLWIVDVQLFAQFGGPINYVVAGETL